MADEPAPHEVAPHEPASVDVGEPTVGITGGSTAETSALPPAPPPWSGPYPAAYYPDPFAPVARAPKTPWIAPQRKGAVIAICIVAAILLLGGGFAIGAVAVHHHDRGFRRFDQGGRGPRQGIFYGGPGQGSGNRAGNGAGSGAGHGVVPRRQGSRAPQRPGGTSSPTPGSSPTPTPVTTS